MAIPWTVTITNVSAPIEIYVGTQAISDYVSSLIGPGPAAFRNMVADDQARLAVSATRYVDSFGWQGIAELSAAPTGATTLQWPRSDLYDDEGNTIAEATQLVSVQQAVCELVALAALDPTALQVANQQTNVSSVGSGSDRVSFFRPGDDVEMPPIVMRLLGAWRSGATAATAAIAGGDSHGTEKRSDFERRDEDTLNWPV